jgi:hypothetical protein
MRDRDDIPLETSEGRSGGSGMGDRLVVGLAALALLGAVLILVGKGLGGDSRGPLASGSPRESSGVSGVADTSATPNPTPEAVTVESRPLPSPDPERPPPFSGWIRLEADLPIYADANSAANRIGALAKGALAYVEEPPDQGSDGTYWLQIDIPNPVGFIAAGKGTRFFVHRYLPTPTAYGGSVAGLAASPSGFVVWGYTSSRTNNPPTPFLAASSDGHSWQPVDYGPFRNAGIRSVTYGPAGWLAMGSAQSNGAQTGLWLWKSTDGRSWRALGSLPVNSTDRDASLLASGSGYLLLMGGFRSQALEGWHSTDGVSWTKGQVPEGNGLSMQHVVATRSGFYAWPDLSVNNPQPESSYSADGQSWLQIDSPPMTGDGRIVSFADGLLAVDSSPVTGAPRAWRGSFSNGGITWTAQPGGLPHTLGFASLASDGGTAMLFGWDRLTDAPKAWSLDASGWQETPLPVGVFGGLVPTTTVGSPAGFVAVGSNLNLRADNPTLWAGTPHGGWSREASPVIAPVGERTDLRCPSKPRDAVSFATLDVPTAVICFGDSPMTFRAYVGRCDGCNGGGGDVYTPAWLAEPGQSQIFLSPIKVSDNWFFGARRAESLADDPRWLDHWVELTGHFDDPASGTCRWAPDPHGAQTIFSAQATINSCRQQFVVTRVRVIAGH